MNSHSNTNTELDCQDNTSNPALSHKATVYMKSYILLKKILTENPILEEILKTAEDEASVLKSVKEWMQNTYVKSSVAFRYDQGKIVSHKGIEELSWSDIAAIRMLDYISNNNIELDDPNLRGKKITSNPIILLWQSVSKGTRVASPFFYEDMLHLLRQLNGKYKPLPVRKTKVETWMKKYPSGLEPELILQREKNRERIVNLIINKIETGEKNDPKFKFKEGLTRKQKFATVLNWWNDRLFHLRFAVRNPKELNKMLDNSLGSETMKILLDAENAGIPFFINPYYLSLLNITESGNGTNDQAIRDYILYSRQLVNEFGHISNWEKEDIVEPGKPNAAGWLIPGHNIHRRYPEVAILIPDTVGRACGGLCSSCQRMYGFQKGELNFDLEKLAPKKTWNEKLAKLMVYFEDDSQLRDILLTGGDALMSSNGSLNSLLNSIYDMAKRKRQKNQHRKPGEKHAEIVRIRLGTRLPVYLPQRITPELINILTAFKSKASKIGIKQFVIQTHFQSPLEVTPEARDKIKSLLSAGWMVTNQLVYTVASSRRGHTTKLRQVLNDIGVLSYYTFSVKGFMENYHHFSTNARLVQEQMEEKIFGTIPEEQIEKIRDFPNNSENMVKKISEVRTSSNLPFLSTDKSVLNIPGVGKSLTFRVIGITKSGRRILQFDHDSTRTHSPIIKKMGTVTIIESKSISEYLSQLQEMGEDVKEYESLYGYSMGETEIRMPIFDFPDHEHQITKKLTNFELSD